MCFFSYKSILKIIILNILSKLKFKCQKCGTNFLYDEIKKHSDECKKYKKIIEHKDNNKKKIKRINKKDLENAWNNKGIPRISCKNNKYSF